ncbi:hypothetical protein EKM02_14675 [Flavobacterium sp. RSP49]|uniref:hypothetical protein n=1 Tax=Flavobacterium sp. RSP49 TaxID=2497487 RepID=UPI000F81B146|nr:hypothetical protein [Flavobacterium sp. RSP49]RTY96878.1 hypothetical protein EKM02_14675 [Flavobacterium sp. RSP49]
MKKLVIIIVLIVGINKSFSQVTDLKIITKQNDTLKNVELKINYFSRIELNYKLQEKLVISDVNGNKKELLPNDVSSFSFNYENKEYNYENVENKIFAQPLYKNKLKLFRFIKSGYTSINFYIIVRPDDGKVSYMEAMGLGRLISKKVISREITDCPNTISKVESKELRINGEEGVIELIKDYEMNCFK